MAGAASVGTFPRSQEDKTSDHDQKTDRKANEARMLRKLRALCFLGCGLDTGDDK